MFSVLAQGRWTPSQIATAHVPSSRPIIPEVELAIEDAWRLAARPGVQLFDGPMCRLESFDASSNQLKLTFSPTSYKPFVGTNLKNPHFADLYGLTVLANPLGASVALSTADGFLLFGRRGGRVAYYPNRIHPFAGCLEPTEADDVFAVVYRELTEEVNLQRSDLADVACLGIARDVSIRQAELVFSATTSLTRADVEARLDATEHDALWSVPLNDVALLDAAIRNPLLTPVAAATLTMWRTMIRRQTEG